MQKNHFWVKTVTIVAMLCLVLLYYATNPKQHITEGTYGLSVQFVTDTLGIAKIQKKNDTLFLEGGSISLDSSGYVFIKGHLEEIVSDSFKFIGNINMFAFKDCCDTINLTSTWTFRRMLNRSFYRLKERESLCDKSCYIYLDIHLK
jgi:hypothetical protein